MLDEEFRNIAGWKVETDFTVQIEPSIPDIQAQTNTQSQTGTQAGWQTGTASIVQPKNKGLNKTYAMVALIAVIAIIIGFWTTVSPAARTKKIAELYNQGRYIEAYELAQKVPSYKTEHRNEYLEIRTACTGEYYDRREYARAQSVINETNVVTGELALLRDMCNAHLNGVTGSMYPTIANNINYRDMRTLFYSSFDAYMEGYFEGTWCCYETQQEMRFRIKDGKVKISNLLEIPGDGTYYVSDGEFLYTPSGGSQFVLHTITILSYEEMIWDSYTGNRYYLYRQ